MDTKYRVSYIDRICDGESEYGWTYRAFDTWAEAFRFYRSCEDYEQAVIQRYDMDPEALPF